MNNPAGASRQIAKDGKNKLELPQAQAKQRLLLGHGERIAKNQQSIAVGDRFARIVSRGEAFQDVAAKSEE